MSVLLGLAAALAWGVHDLCVRFATPGRPVLPLLAVVLAVGLAPVTLLAFTVGSPSMLDLQGALLATGAGLAFFVAGYGLYRAFAIGPVALVAPIVGAFPILTLLAATLSGHTPEPAQLLAVAVIVGGVGCVAVLSPAHEAAGGSRRQAILWSLASSAGFASTFALAQAAAQSGDIAAEWPKMAITRAAALVVTLIAVQLDRQPQAPGPSPLPWRLLIVMGLLDAAAMAAIALAAGLPHPEFAAVVASVFGVVTILLACAFLSEAVRPGQWLAIAAIFSAIASLGI